MKKSLRILTFFLLSINLVYGWGLDMTQPTGSFNCPSYYYYGGGGGQFGIQFNLSAGGGETYEYYANLKKDGQIFYTTGTSTTGTSGIKTISVYYSNICMNNNINVQVVVRQISNSEYKYGNANMIMYYEGSYTACTSPNNARISNETITQINQNWVAGSFLNQTGCGVASATYWYKRYRVEWTVYGNFSNSSMATINSLCRGYSGAIPNYQTMWATIDQITGSSFRIYTFVYELSTIAPNPQYIGFRPCAPGDAAVVYTVTPNPVPIISHFTQVPWIMYPTQCATVTCFLSQGNCCGRQFHWSLYNKPDFISYSINDDKVYLCNNHSGLADLKDEKDAPVFYLQCYVTNQYGTSPTKQFAPIYSLYGGGCPYLFVQDEDGHYAEVNNILHKSEFSMTPDINDKIKLRTSPFITEAGDIVLKILESDRDFSYFDQIELYAVDHYTGTRVGITENNEIVQYDSIYVVSTDSATFNNEEDITDFIQFNTPPPRGLPNVTGDSLDYIYARYPSNGFTNLALITEMERDLLWPVINKTIEANLVTNSNYGTFYSSISMRERLNESIVPIYQADGEPINVYNVDISYLKHFKVEHIALAEISYTGFDSYNIPLSTAELSDVGDVRQFLDFVDQVYVEMDSLSALTLTFNTNNLSPVPDNMTRDYIFVCDGRYVTSYPYSEDKFGAPVFTSKQIKPVNSPREHKLYINYPNPFNPSTEIRFDMKNKGIVKIDVYNILGELVKELFNGYKEAGTYSVTFDASNISSGVYFYVMETDNFFASRKMVLIK